MQNRPGRTTGLGLGAALMLAPFLAAGSESEVLYPQPAIESAEFGYAMAGADGWVAIGAPGENDGVGAVYVFDCSGSACTAPVRLASAAPEDRTGFGAAIAMSTMRLAISSPFRNRGEVEVFSLQSGTWIREARLTAFDGENSDRFGIALEMDANRLLVGADGADQSRGAVYGFERDAGGWNQVQRIVADSRAAGDRFGAAIAIQGDRAWIGAPLQDNDGPGPGFAQGAVFAFVRGASTWQQSQRIESSAPQNGALFGWSLSMVDPAGMIGAPGWNANRGRVTVMNRTLDTWSESDTLQSTAAITGERFGWSLDANDTGVSVSAPFSGFDPAAQCGSVHRFTFDGLNWNAVRLRLRFPTRGQLAGWSVASDSVGHLMGSPTYSSATGLNFGAAYRFEPVTMIFGDGYESGEAGCEPDPG